MDDYDKVDKDSRDRGVKMGLVKSIYRNLVGIYFLPHGSKLEKLKAVNSNIILILISSVCVYTMLINIDFLNIFFEACFVGVALIGVEFSVVNGIIYLESVSRMLYIVGTDCYKYENEENSTSEINEKIKFNIYINKLTKIYKGMIFIGVGSHMLITMFIQPDTLGNYNRNLPALLYLPIETDESNINYLIVVVFFITAGWYMYAGVIALDLGCYMMILHLEHQVKILNDKIKGLELRAMRRMGIIKESAINKYKGRLWNNKEFNKNMYLCLRENIRHHQNIIRFYNLVQICHDNNYLIVIGNGSVLIAMAGYLLTENPEISLLVKAVVMLFTILIHILMYCMFGQRVTDQTLELMENLYDSPWYFCDEKFKKSLLIMMAMVHEPLELKSNFLKHPLTLETFNDVVRAAYSFFNLIRQM